ncbi:unnamed protein product [Phytophthora fragariaefolia]|uniref:Unnamed protein product n=1 Tax=Phytophthora fragariaefolia TaxID=1490495 RepID=A0A9W7CZC9_9STRA|nr:unnamed protein product [Phytophthora fragariaefolia]
MRALVNGAGTDDAWKSKESQKERPRRLVEPRSRSPWGGNELTSSNCGPVDVVLSADFMIPAGVLLDLFQANVKLPDEIMIPLIKTMNMLDEPEPKQILRRYLDNSDGNSGSMITEEGVEDSSVDEDLAGSHRIHEGIVSVAIESPPPAGVIDTAPPRDAASVTRGEGHEAVASDLKTGSGPPG